MPEVGRISPVLTTPYTHSPHTIPEYRFVSEIRGRACSVTIHPVLDADPTLNVEVRVSYRKDLTFHAQFSSDTAHGPWALAYLRCEQDGISASTMEGRLRAELPDAVNRHAEALVSLVEMGRERAAARALSRVEDVREELADVQRAAEATWEEFCALEVPAERAAEILTAIDVNYYGKPRRPKKAPTYHRPPISDRLRARLHRMARFSPIDRGEPTTLPALSVAGVLTTCYIDEETRELHVSISLETAHRALVSRRGTVPLRVVVGDQTVHRQP